VGHQQRLPPPRLSGRCGFGEGTFAEIRGYGEDAPVPAVRSVRSNLVTPSSLKQTLATLFQPGTEADCSREQDQNPPWRSMWSPVPITV
jgi:hypothetical protein